MTVRVSSASSPTRVRALAALMALGLTVGACAAKPEEYVERPVEELYNKAMDALLAENYFEAAKLFDEVERQHPYSVWSSKGQVMAGYAFYQAGKYDDAIVTLDRFLQLNPSNREAPYAFYLKAISYYEQITDVQRDARMTEFALKALDEVVRRYPDSVYSRDARLKIELAYDHLAGKEMEVGRFYLTRGHYLGAINRFRAVVEKYQTTSHIPEALHRLVECYLALGLLDEARKTASVLGYNYPGSEWYVDSYALVESGQLPADSQPKRGLGRRAIDWLF